MFPEAKVPPLMGTGAFVESLDAGTRGAMDATLGCGQCSASSKQNGDMMGHLTNKYGDIIGYTMIYDRIL